MLVTDIEGLKEHHMNDSPKIILVTGASSGIGEATARRSPRRATRSCSAPGAPTGSRALADEIGAAGGTADATPRRHRAGTNVTRLRRRRPTHGTAASTSSSTMPA